MYLWLSRQRRTRKALSSHSCLSCRGLSQDQTLFSRIEWLSRTGENLSFSFFKQTSDTVLFFHQGDENGVLVWVPAQPSRCLDGLPPRCANTLKYCCTWIILAQNVHQERLPQPVQGYEHPCRKRRCRIELHPHWIIENSQ